jgi:acyl-ACP thioesterase
VTTRDVPNLPAVAMAPPGEGRVHRVRRIVRLGDVDTEGRIRLDAVARYAQDVASDDMVDAGLAGVWSWVVRRTTIAVAHRPRFEQAVGVATWCSGTGAAWAERRTTIDVDGRPAVEVSALWVCLDPRTGRPVALEDRFVDVFSPPVDNRRVGGRLRHPGPPPATTDRPWTLRRTDYDALGHVNNAVTWGLVEEEAVAFRPEARVACAEVEYRAAVAPGDMVDMRVAGDATGGLGLWVVDRSGGVRTSAVVRWAGVVGAGVVGAGVVSPAVGRLRPPIPPAG